MITFLIPYILISLVLFLFFKNKENKGILTIHSLLIAFISTYFLLLYSFNIMVDIYSGVFSESIQFKLRENGSEEYIRIALMILMFISALFNFLKKIRKRKVYQSYLLIGFSMLLILEILFNTPAVKSGWNTTISMPNVFNIILVLLLWIAFLFGLSKFKK